jgi:hypothetical protein
MKPLSAVQVRKAISSSLLLIFITLLFSAYWMFFVERAEAMATLHITMGLLLSLISIWHLWRHKKAIVHYVKTKPSQLLPSIILSIGFVIGINLWLPPFNSILEFSDNSRYEQKDLSQLFTPLNQGESRQYQVDNTNPNGAGQPFKISVRTGTTYTSDMAMVMWAEDLQGNFIESLYSTEQLAIYSEELDKDVMKRPESLPHWMHQRAAALNIEPRTPIDKNEEVDGLTGATPNGHFVVNTRLSDANISEFVIKFEVNQGQDWNDFYHKKAHPDDLIYTGDGDNIGGVVGHLRLFIKRK